VKDLSIIIVNWHSGDYLCQCLASIYAHVANIDFEVIVVDNGPAPGVVNEVRVQYPHAGIICAHENRGFAKANNIGFKRSSGRALLFLNPDTEVLGSAVEIMASELNRNTRAAIIGCKLLNSDGTVQTSCIQSFPTLMNQVLGIEWLRLRWPRLRFWGIAPLFDAPDAPVRVDIVSGACLMIRRDIFEKAGMFSEEYFMYAEDMDLCYKVRRLGFDVCYTGRAMVIHHGGGSSRDRAATRVAAIRQKQAMLMFCAKTRGRVYAACYRMAIGLNAVCRLMLILLFCPVKRQSGRQFLSPAFTKWAAVLKWSAGLEG